MKEKIHSKFTGLFGEGGVMYASAGYEIVTIDNSTVLGSIVGGSRKTAEKATGSQETFLDKPARDAVWSLGYNSCAAKLDYSDFRSRHPSDRWFSEKTGRTLKSLVLVFISGGHGRFRSKPSGEMPVPANSVFFVFPGVNHFYRYDKETGWDEQWLELDSASVLPLLEEAGVRADSPLRTFSALPGLADAFSSLIELSRSKRPGAEWLVEAAAHRVIAEALSAWKSGTNDSETPAGRAVERMRQLLTSDVALSPDISAASRIAGMSPSRLRDLFKRATGLSPKRFQMRARLLKAGRLLRETDLPISDIAEQTGFESIFAFSKRFKKLLGLSPRDYRRWNGTAQI